jgi:hypothetical protein
MRKRTAGGFPQSRTIYFMLAILLVILAAVTPDGIANAKRLGGGPGSGNPALTISSPTPPQGPAGTTVIVSGNNWPGGASITVSIGSANGTCDTTTPVNGSSGTANATGDVQVTIVWPTMSPGKYPICGISSAVSGTIISDNQFTLTSQNGPTFSLPSSAASGSQVAFTGANWSLSGKQVEILLAPEGATGCGTSATTVTPDGSGNISGNFLAPSASSNTIYMVTAIAPSGSCGAAIGPSLKQTGTITILGNGQGAVTPIVTPSVTPGSTPTPTGKVGTTVGGVSTCSPLPNSLCSVGGIPTCVVCLLLLLLLALLIWLLLILARRRNTEVVVSEEDITDQIDPQTIAPMGELSFVRVVRVTRTESERNTGQVRRTSTHTFEEFADRSGKIRRRERV